MKNEQTIRGALILLAIVISFFPAQAQEGYSLPQAVEYAIKHNLNIKNAQLDALSAEARIGEVRAAGLPQLSAAVSVTNNIIIPRFFLPANAFDPTAPADAPPISRRHRAPWH